MTSDWLRVSKSKPCPRCSKGDWCSVSPDGVFCICMRTESAKPTKNGGWLHRLKDTPPPPFRPAMRPAPVRPSLVDMGKYHAALRARWTPADLEKWAEALDVWEFALDALQPAWDTAHEALAFPMRDGAGVVTGIRLRNAEGQKWAVRGGGDGLFYDPGLAPKDDLVICEGPTDCAAALSLGLDAVGRPSCSSGVSQLVALVKRLRVRSLTIVADHDAPHVRPDGSTYSPGLDGARKLIGDVGRMARIIVPPAKDIRAWFKAGATREQFDVLARNAKWRMG